MRSLSVFLLVFFPGLLAVVLLWGPGRGREETSAPRTSDREEQNPNPQGRRATFAGTEGRGTFFIKLDRARVRDRDESYPSTYYWLGTWKKLVGTTRFDATDVLVLRNRRPRQERDLAELFVIATDEDAAGRRRKMEEARTKLTHLRANAARFLGAERIEDARDIELEGQVSGRILGPRRGRATDIEAERLDLHFEDKELHRLVLPGEFQLRSDRVELDGSGFDLTRGQEELVVERARRLILYRPAREGRDRRPVLSVLADGRLSFRPVTAPTPAEPGDLFRDFNLDEGDFAGEGRVEVTLDTLRIEADRFRGSHRRLGPEGQVRLKDLFLEGNVRLFAPEGEIRGERVRFETRDGEIIAARVEGAGTSIAWGRAPDAPKGSPYDLEARSETGLVLTRELDAKGETKTLRLEMRQGVQIEMARSPLGPMSFRGDELDVTLQRVRRRGTEGETARLRLVDARIGGGLSGGGEGVRLQARSVHQRFDRDAVGILTGRHLDLIGPASFDRRLAATKTKPERVLGIAAADRVSVFQSASPFAPFEAEAEGTVIVSWKEGDAPASRAQADLAKLVLLDTASAKGLNRLQRLVMTGKVIVDGHQGHALRGDHLDLHEGGRRFEITCAADSDRLVRLDYVDGTRRQSLRAKTLTWTEREGLLVATDRVLGNLVFPSLILTGQDREARRIARENLDDPPSRDRDWDLEAARLEVHFLGTLPLLAPPDAKRTKPGRIRDATARGAVSLRSADQTIEARELYLDPERRSGWASGAPLVATFRDRHRDQAYENRLETDRLDIRPEWTLLQGHADVTLHLISRETDLEGRTTEKLERIHVACTDEVVLKPRIAFFSGHTVFDRGDPDKGGFRISADKAVAYLADTGPKAKPTDLKRLERIEGNGHVDLRWGSLTGRGDKVSYLVPQGQVVLGADRGRQCTMRLRGQNEQRSRSLTYDQRKRRIEFGDTQGIFRRPPRSGGKKN